MNRRQFLPSLPAIAALLMTPRHSAGQPAAQRASSFDELLAAALVPSFAMARVRGDEISTHLGGVRKAGESDKVDADTVYAAASLTKPVVAYVALQLAREGRLDLDRRISTYLTHPMPSDVRGATITLRHLLSHSSGWRNWRNTTADSLVAAFEPGSRWSYSGEGYFLLQRIIEDVLQNGIGAICRDRVFGPLGMARSALVSAAPFEPNVATGHDSAGAPRVPFSAALVAALARQLAARGHTVEQARVADAEAALRETNATLPVLPNFLAPNAASSLLTTANDFGRFIRHLVTARAGSDAADTMQRMITTVVQRTPTIGWGLGLGTERIDGRTVGWQWGDNPGFKHFCAFDPGAREGFVIFTNGDRGARVYERVVRALTGIDHPAFLFV